MTENASDTSVLRITRTVRAPRERVWRAWTDPAEMAAWLWPARFETKVDLDARTGGRFRFASDVTGMAVSGEVVAAEPPARLVLTWQWDGEDAETLVTVDLLESDDATEVVVTHERFATADERDQHAQGWGDCLDRLVTHGF